MQRLRLVNPPDSDEQPEVFPFPTGETEQTDWRSNVEEVERLLSRIDAGVDELIAEAEADSLPFVRGDESNDWPPTAA